MDNLRRLHSYSLSSMLTSSSNQLSAGNSRHSMQESVLSFASKVMGNIRTFDALYYTQGLLIPVC